MLQNKGKIHFFTGKGGVGKSTLALSKALELSEKGYRTLFVEFSHVNTMTRHLKVPVGSKPTNFLPSLDVVSWNGEDCLQEYVKHSVKIKFLFEVFYRSKAMHALVQAAPALKEVSFLGYLTSHHRGVKPYLNYDHIVVDAPSTGHFVSCLQVPQALLEVTSLGPMGYHCRGILEVLKDPNKVQVYTIFLPEDLVIEEQLQLQQTLLEQFSIKPQVWMNRSLLQGGIEAPNLTAGLEIGGAQQRYLEHIQHTLENENRLKSSVTLKSVGTHPEVFQTEPLEVAKSLVKSWEVG